jgi:hypothetical protein
MRNAIALIAGIISFASILPYIRDVNKGKTHPNMVSWLTWCILNLINTIAALSTGATQTALLSGASALATGSVTLLALSHGIKKYTVFDIVCQVLALSGIVAWRLTGQPGRLNCGVHRSSCRSAHMAARLGCTVFRNLGRICYCRRYSRIDSLYNRKIQLRVASVSNPGRI